MTVSHADLDPRSKLAFAGTVAALAVAIPRLGSLAGLALVVTLVVGLGRGLGVREWLGRLAPFTLLVPLIFVLNALFYGGGDVLWRAPLVPVAITTGGIETSTLIAARLLVVASAASWFAATTDPVEFEVALSSLGIPWRFAFVLSLTLRLVPEMRARFRTIEEAQRSRGLTIEGGPVARVRARIPMLVPFLASVARYGFELSDALVVRGFDRPGERTHVVRPTHGRADYVLYVASALLAVAFVGAFLV